MVKTVSTNETSVSFYILHGATSQKTDMFKFKSLFAGPTKERVKTPDSPEGARLILSSAGGNSNSTSPTTATISSSTTSLRYATQSGLTTALQNGANGQAVSTGNVSPVLNGSGASGGESHTRSSSLAGNAYCCLCFVSFILM
jgi:hypothetical protein